MKLRIYKIDLNYIQFLHDFYDSRVCFHPGESMRYNANRPYVGEVFTLHGISYFAPLGHPRPKDQTMKNNPHIFKIQHGEFGRIQLNNMIPVPKEALIPFDINQDPNSHILIAQYIFCQKTKHFILERAEQVYNKRLHPNSFTETVYCDFKALEKGMQVYCKQKGYDFPDPDKHKGKTLDERIFAAR